jgi:hypothetical protein
MRIARASVHLRTDDPDRALEDLGAVLAEPGRLFHYDALEAVDLAAIALGQQGKADEAVRLLGSVDRERDRCGLVVPPPDMSLRETAMSHTQTALGHGWDTAVEYGRTMTLTQAIELAVSEIGAGEVPAASRRSPKGATAAST